MVVQLEQVGKNFGERRILEGVSLSIQEGERIGLIGPNGAGKSTLLNLIADPSFADEGTVSYGKDTVAGYLRQNTGLDRDSTIQQEMEKPFAQALELAASLRRMELAGQAMTQEYQQATARFEALDGYQVQVKIDTVLTGMGFAGYDRNTIIATMSGGEKTRLALAKLLLERPTLLMLDEPTNHLDFATLTWLEDYLSSYRGTVLVVSHDRYFLDRMVTRIWEVDGGTVFDYPGNYTRYKELKAERLKAQQKEYEKQQVEIAKLEDYIRKNMVRASTAASAKSREKKLEAMERIQRPMFTHKTPHFHFTFTKEPVKDLLSVHRLNLKVGQPPKTLCGPLSFEIKRGEKVALIGRNGIGKSTLLKTVLGMSPYCDGEVVWGRNVTTAYYEQENLNLNFENTVLEELWGRYPDLLESQARRLLGSMLITEENVYKKVGVVSGGERARLGFAIMVNAKANTLLFDEPTNHLDLDSKEALEGALKEFAGTLLFVSHDRYFLNAIPTKILELTDEGLKIYPGNYDDYRRQKAKEQSAPKPAAVPKPVKGRGKEQRVQDAKRRAEIRRLEQEMEQQESAIRELEALIADPASAADYQKLEDACRRLEQLHQENDAAMEQWLALTEEGE